MNGVTNCFGVAVSGVAGAFFCLRPPGFCAPDRSLLQRRLAGYGGVCAVGRGEGGSALLARKQHHRHLPIAVRIGIPITRTGRSPRRCAVTASVDS